MGFVLKIFISAFCYFLFILFSMFILILSLPFASLPNCSYILVSCMFSPVVGPPPLPHFFFKYKLNSNSVFYFAFFPRPKSSHLNSCGFRSLPGVLLLGVWISSCTLNVAETKLSGLLRIVLEADTSSTEPKMCG